MQLLYQSDQYLVLHIDTATQDLLQPSELQRAGYEIVDKASRSGVFIEGALAERFRAGVQALAQHDSDMDTFDDYIAGFAGMTAQPLHLH